MTPTHPHQHSPPRSCWGTTRGLQSPSQRRVWEALVSGYSPPLPDPEDPWLDSEVFTGKVTACGAAPPHGWEKWVLEI